MKIPKLLSLTLVIVIWGCINVALSQNLAPKERVLEPDHTISSEIMERDYQLYISFPQGYSVEDTTSYPVLYVLDGKFVYPIFSGAIEVMGLGREIEDVIIVGIGSGTDRSSWYKNRYYDYTPTSDTTSARTLEVQLGLSKGSLISGGAGKYLDVIKTEIDPFIGLIFKV